MRVTDASRLEEIAETLRLSVQSYHQSGLLSLQVTLLGQIIFKEGLLTIQDETSQLVAPTLGIQGEEEILDACAAPGGKTVHMASYLTSGHVTALDLYDHKLALIEENAQRLGLADKVKTQKLDASKVHQVFPADSFDKILVDAPCSGIGGSFVGNPTSNITRISKTLSPLRLCSWISYPAFVKPYEKVV